MRNTGLTFFAASPIVSKLVRTFLCVIGSDIISSTFLIAQRLSMNCVSSRCDVERSGHRSIHSTSFSMNDRIYGDRPFTVMRSTGRLSICSRASARSMNARYFALPGIKSIKISTSLSGVSSSRLTDPNTPILLTYYVSRISSIWPISSERTRGRTEWDMLFVITLIQTPLALSSPLCKI